MTDVELVEYYLPHRMMHWPHEVLEMVMAIKKKLKTVSGKDELEQLREEYEYNWIEGHRYDGIQGGIS